MTRLHTNKKAIDFPKSVFKTAHLPKEHNQPSGKGINWTNLINTHHHQRKSLNIKAKHIYSLKNLLTKCNEHLPATEVRRMVRQIPNLARDFMVMRPTAMTVCIDIGLADSDKKKSPDSLVVRYFSSKCVIFLAPFSSHVSSTT